MMLSNCSSASTEIPEELAAGGRPSSAASMATSEQAALGPILIQPTIVEATIE
jgi:hypothetical protein